MISKSILIILLSTLFYPARSQNVQETLVPINSLTPLTCDAIFNKDETERAMWYRNGKSIGLVSSRSNHIYEQRSFDLDEIPEVGFLIIPDITLKDEGDYWCELEGRESTKPAKIYRLRVAFIEAFSENQLPISRPSSPEIGRKLTIECPSIKSHPRAVVSWKFNDEVVDFSTGRIEVTQNGSLFIRRFQMNDSGIYSCTWSNFAGHSTTQIELIPPNVYHLEDEFVGYSPISSCSPYFRNGLLWFLIGCLSTSCIVLIYLMAGLICYKYSRQTIQFTPLHSVLQTNPTLAPGFRKVVAPVPDYIRRPNTSSDVQDV